MQAKAAGNETGVRMLKVAWLIAVGNYYGQ
jgi:hypothetical protein